MLAPHLFPPRADGTDPRKCPSCEGGRLSLKLGKFGAFIGCSNYPDCRFTRTLSVPGEGDPENGHKRLGEDPATGLEVTLRSGRFGPYVQLGEAVEGEKPKRAGLPRGLAPDDVDLDRALKLLALPREVGRHPETGEPIRAGIGRFGPYVQTGKTYASLESGDDVLTIGLNRAVTLIAEKKLKGKSGRRFGPDPGRPLGDHPVKGGPIMAKNGRYGPYVSHDGVNATLPRDKTPETITLDEAIGLIDARAEALGGAPPRRRAAGRKAAKPAGLAEPNAPAPRRSAANGAKRAATAAKKAVPHKIPAPASAKPARRAKASD
jgi:DNA topoisomerase-1